MKWSAIYLLVVKADGKWTLESPLDNKTNKPAINLPNVKKSDAAEVTFCIKSPRSVNLKYFNWIPEGSCIVQPNGACFLYRH